MSEVSSEKINPKNFRKPTDITDLVYHTKRPLGEGGDIHAWVYKPYCGCGERLESIKVGKRIKCPKCQRPEFKKASARSKELKCGSCTLKMMGLYCEDCDLLVEMNEDNFDIQLNYSCPSCSEVFEKVLPWKRTKGKNKKFKWNCDCGADLQIEKLK